MTKRFPRNGSCIFDHEYTKELTQGSLGRQGNRICWRVEKNCKAEGKQIHFTVSETKAAFAERAMWSLKNIQYRYMDYGYKYLHKLSKFVSHFLQSMSSYKKITQATRKCRKVDSRMKLSPWT